MEKCVEKDKIVGQKEEFNSIQVEKSTSLIPKGNLIFNETRKVCKLVVFLCQIRIGPDANIFTNTCSKCSTKTVICQFNVGVMYTSQNLF